MPAPEIRHIQEPKRLTFAWRESAFPSDEHRTWRRVGELVRTGEPATTTLNYLIDMPDYQAAVEQGFQGHPAFPIEKTTHSTGVLESFMKRLPPRTRRDFPEYLGMFRLPIDANISDFALLGYTGARLPSDDFAILLPVEDFVTPFEIVTEVSGVRYEAEVDVKTLEVGAPVTLEAAPHPKDPHAVNGSTERPVIRLFLSVQ
jgi:hypothetical protein